MGTAKASRIAPSAGPNVHGPTKSSSPVLVIPSTASSRMQRQQHQRQQRHEDEADDQRRLDRELADDPPQRAVGQHVHGLPPGAARAARGGRQRRHVARRGSGWRAAGRARTRRRQIMEAGMTSGNPIPIGGQRRADQQEEHGGDAEDGQRQRDREVADRAAGVVQPLLELAAPRSLPPLHHHVAGAAEGLDAERRLGGGREPAHDVAPGRALGVDPVLARPARSRARCRSGRAARAAGAGRTSPRRRSRCPRARRRRSRRSRARRCRRCAWSRGPSRGSPGSAPPRRPCGCPRAGCPGPRAGSSPSRCRAARRGSASAP